MTKLVVIDEQLKTSLRIKQPESPVVGDGSRDDSKHGRMLRFRLPCDTEDRLFLFQNSILYELQKSGQRGKTSWFMDNEVLEDGSFYILTPFQVRSCCASCDNSYVLNN